MGQLKIENFVNDDKFSLMCSSEEETKIVYDKLDEIMPDTKGRWIYDRRIVHRFFLTHPDSCLQVYPFLHTVCDVTKNAIDHSASSVYWFDDFSWDSNDNFYIDDFPKYSLEQISRGEVSYE